METAFRDNPDAVAELFGYDSDNDGVRDDGGISNSMYDFLSDVALPATGDIAKRQKLLHSRLTNVDGRIKDLEKSLAEKEVRLTEEYNNLNQAVMLMNLQMQNMNSQLASILG